MRPKNNPTAPDKKEGAEEEASDRCELDVVEWEAAGNKARELIEGTVEKPVNANWEVSKDEYLQHLTK